MHNLLLALNAKKKKRFSELLLFARRASLRLSFLSFFFPAKWLTKVCTPLKLGAYITWGLLCVCYCHCCCWSGKCVCVPNLRSKRLENTKTPSLATSREKKRLFAYRPLLSAYTCFCVCVCVFSFWRGGGETERSSEKEGKTAALKKKQPLKMQSPIFEQH